MKILTASQMREVDRQTTEQYGVPSILLMENAGRSVVEVMLSHFGSLHHFRIIVLAGKGNNGGDAFVVARHLTMRGCRPHVLLFASTEEIKGDARVNFDILEKMKVPVQTIPEAERTERELVRLLRDLDANLIVDGLLGTGVRLPLKPEMAAIIRSLRSFPRLVSIDIPSGLECESLEMNKELIMAPRAELTVTFTAPKPPHIFYPGAAFVGKWVVVPIGTPLEIVDDERHWLNTVSARETNKSLAKLIRFPESHKGNFGHVLVIAGSLTKTGAAVMTAKSALLAGAGLVTLATPAPCLPIVAAQSFEIMTEPLEATEHGTIAAKAFDYGRISELVKGKNVIALGPGLGMSVETQEFARRLLRETALPLVLDADGINAFVGHLELLRGRKGTLILTPHPGEFSRLVGKSTAEVQSNRVGLAREFAKDYEVHLVLKGHRSLYAAPSGQVYVNLSGNPGMATGGSGDVLTGIVAGLVGQGVLLPPLDATAAQYLEEIISLAVFLHGFAGDLAAARVGNHSLIAGDIMESISAAFMGLKNPNSV